MQFSPDRIREIIKEELDHVHKKNQADESSFRVQTKLSKIANIADKLSSVFEEDDGESHPWIEEKVEVAAALLKSILDFKNGEDPR